MKKVSVSIALVAACSVAFSAVSFSQEEPDAKREISGQSSPAAGKPGDAAAEMETRILGEWEYRWNERLWRRHFNPDGTIELWLEGKRDGTWLSDLRWKPEQRGNQTVIAIFRGEKKIAELKLKNVGKELHWQELPERGGPKMTRIAPEKFWKPAAP